MDKVLEKLNRKRKAPTPIAKFLSNKKNKTSECEHFSLRGYVAEVLKKDKKICCPFGDHYKLEEQKQTSLHVPESRWWKCQNSEGFQESSGVNMLDRREAILDNSLPVNNEAALFGNMEEKGIELDIPVAQDTNQFSDAVTREKNVNMAIYVPSCSGVEIILGDSDFSNGDNGFDSSSIKTIVESFGVKMLDKQGTTSDDSLLAVNDDTRLSRYKEEKGAELDSPIAQGVEITTESSEVEMVDRQETASDDALLVVNDDTRLFGYKEGKGAGLDNLIVQGVEIMKGDFDFPNGVKWFDSSSIKTTTESSEVEMVDRQETTSNDVCLVVNDDTRLSYYKEEKGAELDNLIAQGVETTKGGSDFPNGVKGFISSSEVKMVDRQKSTSDDALLVVNDDTRLSCYKEEKGPELDNPIAQDVHQSSDGIAEESSKILETKVSSFGVEFTKGDKLNSDFSIGNKGSELSSSRTVAGSSEVKIVDEQEPALDDSLPMNTDSALLGDKEEKGTGLENSISQGGDMFSSDFSNGNKESRLPFSGTTIESSEVKMFDGETILEDSLPANTDTTIFGDKKEKRIEFENPIVPGIHQDSDHMIEENFKNLPVYVSSIATASKESEINMADGKNSILDDSLPISNDMKIYGEKKEKGAELESPITLFPPDVHQDSDDIIEENFKNLAIDASSIVTTSKESEVNMADGENSVLNDSPPKSSDMKIHGDNETQPMDVPSSGLNSIEGGTVAAIGTSSEKEHEIDEKMYGEKSITDINHQVNTLEDRQGLFANKKENQTGFVDPVTKDTVTGEKNTH